MASVIDRLNAAGIPFTGANLQSIQSLVTRYNSAGFNVSEDMILNFIIEEHKKENPEMKEIFSKLHTMKLAPIKKGVKINRNALCPCGSEIKYKKCCL